MKRRSGKSGLRVRMNFNKNIYFFNPLIVYKIGRLIKYFYFRSFPGYRFA